VTDRQIAALVERFVPEALAWGLRAAGVLLVLWITLRLAAWLQRRVTGGLRARQFDETLSVFFGNLARWTLMLVAILACLSVFGIETTSLAAMIGAASLAVGLAFQGTLANFAAGVMLLVFRPFKIGDFVSAAGHSGRVHAIGLFSTSLDTADNRRIVVPNTAAANGTIENVSENEMRRVDVDVMVDANADLDATRAALDEAAGAVPGRDPERGHQIFLSRALPAGTEWQVRVWCRTEDYSDVWEATVRAARLGLRRAGIAIPTPAPVAAPPPAR
jgi:small conductance mechanosensitive channel